MKIFSLLFIAAAFSLIVSGQDFQPIYKSKMSNTQPVTYRVRIYKQKAKLSLQKATKVMERYIEKEKIDTSNYFIWQVRLIRYGSNKENRPAWHFWWLSKKGNVGDYIQIVVFMNKKAKRTLSM